MCFETNRPRESVGHLREALECDPQFAEAHYDLGAVLIELGDLVDGTWHLQRAVKLEPGFADAH